MQPIITMIIMVPMIVRMRVLGRPNILHLVDTAALGAALDGAVARDGQPDGDVRVGWAAGAAAVLLFTEGFDDYGVVHCACFGQRGDGG